MKIVAISWVVLVLLVGLYLSTKKVKDDE